MDIEAEIHELLRDEMYITIISAIQLFGSLNLKTLADVFKKSEATMSRKLKELEKDHFLDFDGEMSSKKWGKFYKLSPKTVKLLNYYENFKIDLKNPKKSQDYLIVLRYISHIFNTILEFSSSYVQKLITRAMKEDATLEGQQLSLSRLGVKFYDLYFDSPDQIDEYSQIVSQFHQDIEKFTKSSESSKYHQFVGELSAPYKRIHPYSDDI